MKALRGVEKHMSATHQWMEEMARREFGSDWDQDSNLRRFISAIAERQEAEEPRNFREDFPRKPAPYLGGLKPEDILRLVLDTMPNAVFWKDLDSNFIEVNQAFARDHGYYQTEDMIGRNDFDLADAELAKAYQTADREVMITGRPITRQRERAMRNGEIAWLETSKVPIHNSDAEICGLLGTYFDVTKQVRYEENLRLACSELSEASRFKDIFMATVSHELRTPLNPILALAQSLSEGMYGKVDERQKGALAHIQCNAEKLHGLIENILDISALEFGDSIEIVPSPVMLPQLLGDVSESVRGAARSKGVGLEICNLPAAGTHFFLDYERTRKILGILADNAVKFTPGGGRVTFTAKVDEAGGTLALHVTDNGIGISDEQQPQLFKTFEQLDRKLGRAHNGAGVGLALAKRLAGQHGGNIIVESSLGSGSRFTLELPLRTRYSEVA
ncbi:MAG: two-component system sensor histidine kinase/response regulator [Verrucomicrobiales bacterium]|jgi:two-component system sensor histidine kinase/response regulator